MIPICIVLFFILFYIYHVNKNSCRHHKIRYPGYSYLENDNRLELSEEQQALFAPKEILPESPPLMFIPNPPALAPESGLDPKVEYMRPW